MSVIDGNADQHCVLLFRKGCAASAHLKFLRPSSPHQKHQPRQRCGEALLVAWLLRVVIVHDLHTIQCKLLHDVADFLWLTC